MVIIDENSERKAKSEVVDHKVSNFAEVLPSLNKVSKGLTATEGAKSSAETCLSQDETKSGCPSLPPRDASSLNIKELGRVCKEMMKFYKENEPAKVEMPINESYEDYVTEVTLPVR